MEKLPRFHPTLFQFTPFHFSILFIAFRFAKLSAMADVATDWSADIAKIRHIVQELNEAGNVPKALRNDLESRLVLAWGDIAGPQDRSTTAWRKRNARNVYQDIQDESHHLFLAFILAMGPTACSRTGVKNCIKALLKADTDRPHKLRLNLVAKELFESMAIKRGFGGNSRYVEFIKSLFSEGLLDLIILL